MAALLEVEGLKAYYGQTRALHDVSFTIRPGEILGYLGPNGAGKSTTVKMLIGLLEPTSGHVEFHGQDIHRDLKSYQRRIGYVPEEPHLYPHLSGREYLQLVGRLRGMVRSALEPKMDELLRLNRNGVHFDPNLTGVVVFGQSAPGDLPPTKFDALRLTLPNSGGELEYEGASITLTTNELSVYPIEADSQDR